MLEFHPLFVHQEANHIDLKEIDKCLPSSAHLKPRTERTYLRGWFSHLWFHAQMRFSALEKNRKGTTVKHTVHAVLGELAGMCQSVSIHFHKQDLTLAQCTLQFQLWTYFRSLYVSFGSCSKVPTKLPEKLLKNICSRQTMPPMNASACFCVKYKYSQEEYL